MYKCHGDKIIISYFEIIMKLCTTRVHLFWFIKEQSTIRCLGKKTKRVSLSTLYALYDLV